MPRRALVLPVLATATALVASGLVAGSAAAAAPHGRSAVTFHTTADHHVVAPTTTRPGIAHLRNTGTADVLLIEAKHGTGDVHQAAKVIRAPSPKPLLKSYRLITIAPGGTGSYTELTPGTYYFADLEVEHLKAKRIDTMTVTGSQVDARTPRGRGVAVTTHRHLRLPSTIATSGFLHVQNHSSALAEFLFVGVDNAATRAMLNSLVAHPNYRKLAAVIDVRSNPVLFTPIVASGPHSVSWVHYHGRPGRYIAAMIIVTKAFNPKLHHSRVRILTLK